MALRLSNRCRKDALKNPCYDKALAATKKKCKGVTGRGYGACMTSNLEAQLVKHCRDAVCPGDPTAVVETNFQGWVV